MTELRNIADSLARVFLGGEWQVHALQERGQQALARKWRFLPALVEEVMGHFGSLKRPAQRKLTAFLETSPCLIKAVKRRSVRILLGMIGAPRFQSPLSSSQPWTVRPLDTVGQLADWLEVTPAELDWFADRRRLTTQIEQGPLQHYRYTWHRKRSVGWRLLEAPKPRLKQMQRRILNDILNAIPTHAAAHGFRRGRSIQSFVHSHVARDVVLRMDLDNFFPTIASHRIVYLLMWVGYPENVARTLAALCTNETPQRVFHSLPPEISAAERQRYEALYQRPHLPQGAPTSPALANLCAFRLDCRLDGLAVAAGASYSRYADDLLFSGDAEFRRGVQRFRTAVHAIALEEGFQITERKTRIMTPSVRQRAAGIVLNVHQNFARDEFDRLKATLFNAARSGPTQQNRTHHADFRAHLAGRIAFVKSLNPARGQKLQAIFETIDWSK